jgi:WD40 repeat protein
MTGTGGTTATTNTTGGNAGNNPPSANVPRKRGRKTKHEALMRAAALLPPLQKDGDDDKKKDENTVVEMKDVHDNSTTSVEEEYQIQSSLAKARGGGYVQLPGFGDHKRAVSSVKFASSRLTKRGAVVASSSADGSIKLWDVQEAFAFSGSHGNNGNSNNNSTKTPHRRNSYDPDGFPIITTTTNTSVRRNSTGAGGVNDVSSSFVSGNNDNNNNSNSNKKNSNTKPMEPILQCMGHSRGINEIAWNPVAPLLASASDDKTVRILCITPTNYTYFCKVTVLNFIPHFLYLYYVDSLVGCHYRRCLGGISWTR